MTDRPADDAKRDASTRRRFLGRLGQGAVAGAVAGPFLSGAGCSPSVEPSDADGQPTAQAPAPGKVPRRTLGKTGLKLSEIGFGGHSWSYRRVPDGRGELRKVTVDECAEILAAGMEMGVNFLDSCTPMDEASAPAAPTRSRSSRRTSAPPGRNSRRTAASGSPWPPPRPARATDGWRKAGSMRRKRG